MSSLYDCTANYVQWFFDHAKLLELDGFIQHLEPDAWTGTIGGFIARPLEDTNLWEILCPELVHKIQVSTECLTSLVAQLPEGTKIDIGGFKNV